jgi:AraC-like DNA-binding protein
VHRQCRSAVADLTTVVVFGADEEVRVSHPIAGGDDSIALTLRLDVHEDAFGSSDGQIGRLSAMAQLRVAVLACALRHGREGVFACEEAAVRLAEEVALGVRRDELNQRVSPRQRRRSDEVRALLAEDVARRWSLAELGQAVQCSPFHLARQFRLATGETLSGHLLRLRLAAALQHMAEGEDDLARIATHVGFSHHSHFSARFRAVFGCTPSRARSLLHRSSFPAK